MPIFGNKDKFQYSKAAAFSNTYTSGHNPPAPGIFECQECNKEMVMNRAADPLPPCSACDGKTWLLVAAPKGEV
ncbi:hypothetical protein HNP10_003622 [Aeromonas veronii]|uniref:zinc ribbon-containing protein n=1 Tax=Aeromonas veronii TaxID=654 RepID=UPI00160B4A56|nr:hypothetical protein [Aeromonas veronii]MCS3834822.1 hypothetical protein [Aeromonas veronii]